MKLHESGHRQQPYSKSEIIQGRSIISSSPQVRSEITCSIAYKVTPAALLKYEQRACLYSVYGFLKAESEGHE
jgi:hypothetical protein